MFLPVFGSVVCPDYLRPEMAVIIRTSWGSTVTLQLGQWVALDPEDELLRALALHSSGGRGCRGSLVRTLGAGAQVVASVLV